jgi:IS30 family transposase
MPGLPLSLYEREEIGVALIENRRVAWAVIGRQLGRDPTTIAREVKRGGGRNHYRPAAAHAAASTARERPRECSLAAPGPVRNRIVAELRRGRSPYAIWADMDAEGVVDRPCVETIYTCVYNGSLGVKARDCLRSRRPRRRSRQARHPNKRAGLPNISARPDHVNDRTEVGHWEADQIIGKANGSSMIWLVERVTRYSIPITMPCGYTAIDVLAGLVEGLEQIPAHLLRSLTFDQGSEWAEWETIAASYRIDCWFCDPHSPWQRGQIENHNRQARWWFPRGTRLDNIAQADADHAAATINGQRRRSLANHSPTMLYAAASIVH